MIRDARVLQPEFIPREVQHRNAELNALSNALDPVTRGEPADTAFLFGRSGTGKTCMANFAVEQLREEVLDIETQYVNCWRHYTRFSALQRILAGFDAAYDIHRQSTPTDELLDRVRSYDGPPYVAILDEVDQLEDLELLYDLYQTPGVSMVLIANREEPFFAQLNGRLSSRLHSSRRIEFSRYDTEELVAIMAARVRWGLEEGAVETPLLRRIADEAAGDARIAIGILRNAARDAHREGRDSIDASTVEGAIPTAREEVQQTNLDTLTPHQAALYDLLDEHGELDPGELYGLYQERVDDPKTKRTVRSYLTKLVQYDLAVATGEGRARTYRLR